jgi:hypothetical protein
MMGQQPSLFLQLTNHRLFRCFVLFYTALRKLPGILSDPSPPKNFASGIGEHYTHIWTKTLRIYHLPNLIFIFIVPSYCSTKHFWAPISPPCLRTTRQHSMLGGNNYDIKLANPLVFKTFLP